MRIPAEFLWPYLIANAVALLILIAAFWRPTVARWIGVVIFAWASLTNAVISLNQPERYVEYATLTPSTLYRDFILGWFSQHVQAFVLPIAFGQMAIAILLAMRSRRLRLLGLAGALVFLLAISPLGIGAGFPFSITFGLALTVAVLGADVRSPAARDVLRWTPRVLGLALVLFLSLFALDAFSTGFSVRALAGFAIHLLPAAVVLGVVLLSWRWPWLGGILCFALAVTYAVWARGYFSWMVVISGPLIVEGALFLWSWRTRVSPAAGR